MKVELLSSHRHGLVVEGNFFAMVQADLTFFPRLIEIGATDSFRFLVMELFGPSLLHMRRTVPDRAYSSLTALRLGYHSLCCIESLHRLGLIHRDLKPGNFLIRPDDREHPVVLIDFGLSCRYRTKRGHHIRPREGVGFVGTCRYASLHAHAGEELSRRDDLISWFYVLLDLVEGRMPWPGKKDKQRCIRRKRRFGPEHLCRSFPPEFTDRVAEIFALEFEQEPDYDAIKRTMCAAIEERGGMDAPYDWQVVEEQPVVQAVEEETPLEVPPVVEGEPLGAVVEADANEAVEEAVLDVDKPAAGGKRRGRRKGAGQEHATADGGCVGCSVA
jgi:serine/threonine protein kinase